MNKVKRFKKKKYNMTAWIAAFGTIGIIVLVICGSYITSRAIENSATEVCQKYGYERMTDLMRDYDYSYPMVSRLDEINSPTPYRIECDGKVMHQLQCITDDRCLKFNKWNQCTKEQIYLRCIDMKSYNTTEVENEGIRRYRTVRL